MVKTTGVTQPTHKVRLGRFTECDQPHNSIVLNASNANIDNIEHSGFYVTPIRYGHASNLLAYDCTTKEIIDVGGQKLKISSLEVENLDVVNSNTIHSYYVDNPIFEIAKGNTKNSEDVGIIMRRSGGDVELKFSEKDKHLNVNKDLKVDGAIHARTFYGDGGLLSNVQFDFEIGDTFENLNVTNALRADGGLLSNISIQQLKDLNNASLNLNSVYVEKVIHGGSIVSRSSVIAPTFIGDGQKLTGIAHTKDLESNVSRIEKLELFPSRVELVELGVKGVQDEIKRIAPLEEKAIQVAHAIDALKPLEPKVQILENYVTSTSTHQLPQRMSYLEKEVKSIKPTIPDVTQIIQDVNTVREKLTSIPLLEDSIRTVERVIPRVRHLESVIGGIDTNASKISGLTTKVTTIESIIKKIDDIEPIQLQLSTLARNTPNQIKYLETHVSKRIDDVAKEIVRFNPLEALVSNIHTSETDISTLKIQLPTIDTRIKVLEDVPVPTLHSVTSCQSNTVNTLTLENQNVSLTTFGNIGVGTTQPTSKISIFSLPNAVSSLGEVDAIKINELAQINAYTKANAGLSSGRPGGLVFKTKRPNGELTDSMTIDGNGSVTVGSSTPCASAALAINSTTRGLLVPRMTTEDIQNIRKPEPGLIVYDTELDTFMGYKKTGWTQM